MEGAQQGFPLVLPSLVPTADMGGHVLELVKKHVEIDCNRLMWISIPKEMGGFSKLLCVIYMMVPVFVTFGLMLKNLPWDIRKVGWPTGDYPTKSWSREDRRRVGKLAYSLKLTVFFVFCHVLSLIESILFRGIHATGLLELHTDVPLCKGKMLTFPSFTAFYSIALLTVLKVELDFCLSVKYLIWENRYTQDEVERLGFGQIGMERFFFWSLSLMLGLIPPAVAVVAMGNAGFADAFLGVIQGIVVGIGFHSFWVKMFRHDAGGSNPILDWLDDKLLVPFLREVTKLVGVSRSEPLLPVLERSNTDQLIDEANANMTDRSPPKSVLPGMEFFHIRMDSLLNNVIDSFGSVKDAQDGLRQKQHIVQRGLQQKAEAEEEKAKNLEVEIEKIKKEVVEKLEVEKAAKAEEFEQEKKVMNANFEEQKAQHMEELSGTRSRLMTEIEDIKESHLSTLEAEREAQQKQLEDEKKAMLAKMDELRAESASKMAEERERQEKQLEDEKQAMIEKSLEEKKAMTKSFEEEKETQAKQFDEEREKQAKLLENEKQAMNDKMEQLQMENTKKLTEERERQEKQLEEEKQAMNQKIQEMYTEQSNRLAAEKEKTEKQFAEEKQKMTDDFEKMKQEQQAKHEEDLRTKDEFSRNLVGCSESLTEMTRAIDKGNWTEMNKMFNDLREKQRKMTEGGTNKELSRMLASITPIFDGKLEEVREKQREWKKSLKLVVEALEKAEALKKSEDIDSEKEGVPPLAKDLFRYVSEMIKNGLGLEQADAAIEAGMVEEVEDKVGSRVQAFLCDRWLECTAKYRKFESASGVSVQDLQDRIVKKAIWSSRHELGSFDFTDLETCVEAVDVVNLSFLDKATELIDKRTASQLTGALSQLFTMLYFLEHLEKENQAKCRSKFLEKLGELKSASPGAKKIAQWVKDVEQEYSDDCALLQEEDLKDITNKDVKTVIDSMCSEERRTLCTPKLKDLYDIFCSLAEAWQKKFDVLAVPHHTQVFALLVFSKFLDEGDKSVQTLIGQVGTGEGKSMLIAELAALCARKGKKVHVVGTDSKLVMRDYASFRELFNKLNINACVCSDMREGEDESDVVRGISDDADIVYCEPKHVESFYVGKARRGDLGDSVYQNRVLILDEVDSLVVDQEPTQAFVYDIGWRAIDPPDTMTISEYATKLVNFFLTSGVDKTEEEIPAYLQAPPAREGEQPTEKRQMFDEVRILMKQVMDWNKKPQEEKDREFRHYEGDWKLDNGINLKNKFVHVVNKVPRCDANSPFLEVLRVFEAHENQYEYPMRWFQKLFVMSKPRVFRQYQNIMGFSGTIGNEKEQKFFRDSYGAEFFLVPPFLSTCVDKDDPKKELFHTANWCGKESGVGNMYRGIMEGGGAEGPLVIVNNSTKQFQCVKGLAMKAREHVPILVIARDTNQAKEYVKMLRRDIPYGDDVIRSLSQSDYDKNPTLYKESLKKSTQAMGAKGKTSFRITVTDPSGARGTDYQMRDEDCDKLGGLMLIVLHIPLSERDWVQYKGRTARQKWRGQYCAVLQAQEYQELEVLARDKEYEVKEALPPFIYESKDKEQLKGGGDAWVCSSSHQAEEVVQQILAFGGEEAEAKLKMVRAVYNSGFIANELCEEVWITWKDKQVDENGVTNVDIKLSGAGRDAFLEICNRYRYLSADAIQERILKITDGRTKVKYNTNDTEAPNRDYIPEVPPKDTRKKKAVLFVMDVSFSMNKGEPPRLETCKEQMKTLLTSRGFLGPEDFVGVVAFGKGKRWLLPKQEELRVLHRANDTDASGATQLAQVTMIADGRGFEDAMGNMGEDTALGLKTEMYKTMNEVIEPFMSDDWIPKGGDDEKDDEEIQRCLVVLCDGGDSSLGVHEYNKAMKNVASKVGRTDLTLIMITVGSDQTLVEARPKMKDMVKQGSPSSAYFHADDDPDAIKDAFKQVQAALSFSGGVGIVQAS